LRELAVRLLTKEDLIRFIVLAEDRGYLKKQLPAIAQMHDIQESLAQAACLLARFGCELQAEERFKEAEFVQRLALALDADHYFTNLPLAATYYETGRYEDARPLFERGLAQLEKLTANTGAEVQPFSPALCLGPDIAIGELRGLYGGKYEACLKACGAKGK
jgi:hypothetical protein